MASSNDEPYIGPDGLLENLVEATSSDALNKLEWKLSMFRAAELTTGKVVLEGKGDLDHLKAVHHHLFQDVYPWAGERRDVRGFTGYKPEPLLGNASVDYPAHDSPDRTTNLNARLDYAFAELAKENGMRGLGNQPEVFISRLSRHVAEIWECHAFREGNTRTMSLFAMELSRLAGQPFQRTLINQDASIRDSLVLAATRNEYSPLKAILSDCLIASDAELYADKSGSAVPLDKKLLADIERARDTIVSASSAILEKMTAFEDEAVRAIERIADESARVGEKHQANRPAPGFHKARDGHEAWEREHRRLDLEASIARQNATEARARFERNAGVRESRSVADAEFENGPEAALLKRSRMIDKTVELHDELKALVTERESVTEEREVARLDRRINDIATTLTKSPFCRMALDPPARRFAQLTKHRSGRSLELHLKNQRKLDLGHSR